MDEDKQQKLLKTFPNLYKAYYWPMTQTCMCWGFDVGNGWNKLIWDLSRKLENILLQELPEVREGIYAEQVKSKYGGLRFYMSSYAPSSKMERYIDDAEYASERTCESCGEPGELHTDGWWRTHCESCEAEFQTKRAR